MQTINTDCIRRASSNVELAAALLTVFFNGHMTQSCLNMMLKLVNIISDIKVPTRFDSLLSLILKNTDQNYIGFDKRWYCEVCYKLIEQPQNRFQRSCSMCKSKSVE